MSSIKKQANSILPQRHKLISYSLIPSFIGFLVSAYLTILHYKNIIPPCSTTRGCEVVLTSKYSMVGPIPVALLGVAFFLGIFLLALLVITNYKKTFLDLFYFSASIGLLVSLTLIFIQAQVLHQFCQYCLTCEACSIGVALLGYLDFREKDALS